MAWSHSVKSNRIQRRQCTARNHHVQTKIFSPLVGYVLPALQQRVATTAERQVEQSTHQKKLLLSPADETAQTRRSILLPKQSCKAQFGRIVCIRRFAACVCRNDFDFPSVKKSSNNFGGPNRIRRNISFLNLCVSTPEMLRPVDVVLFPTLQTKQSASTVHRFSNALTSSDDTYSM